MRLLHLQFADFAARFSVFLFSLLLLQLVAITAHATQPTAQHTVPQKCGLPLLLLIKFTLSLQNEVPDADSDAFGRQ